jgi:hypothetical protein
LLLLSLPLPCCDLLLLNIRRQRRKPGVIDVAVGG